MVRLAAPFVQAIDNHIVRRSSADYSPAGVKIWASVLSDITFLDCCLGPHFMMPPEKNTVIHFCCGCLICCFFTMGLLLWYLKKGKKFISGLRENK